MRKTAICNDPKSLKYVPFENFSIQKSVNLCEYAMLFSKTVLKYLPCTKLGTYICTKLLENNGLLLKYIPECHKTEYNMHQAVINNPLSIQYVSKKNRSLSMISYAVITNPESKKFLYDDEITPYLLKLFKLYNIK